MRTGITVNVSAAARVRLEGIVAARNSPQKHVWRARIVLLTAEGLGTNEIMRRTGKSKTCLWRWQARFMHEGVEGLLRDDAPVAGCAAAAGGCRARRRADADRSAGRDDPLDGRRHGQSRRDQPLLGAAHLAHPWAPAASGEAVQTVVRSGIRPQATRHRRALHRPAGARYGAQRRRKIADPGARPHPAGLADQAGALRNDDP